MKYTLLDMVQTVLSEMDSDEVNSINDNVEAQQVAKIIRTTYFDLVANLMPPENFTQFQLEASGSASKPTLMTRPSNVNTIEWVKYNKIQDGETASNFRLLTFMPNNEFFQMMDSLNTDEDEVATFSHTIGTSTFNIPYRNDKSPDYYTTFDDNTLLFDSYDSEVDTTLQKTKTRCYGLVGETFSLSDSYIPTLDDQQFSLLLNQAIRRAFVVMKQVEHPVALEEVKRQRVSFQRTKKAVKDPLENYRRLPIIGRKHK